MQNWLRQIVRRPGIHAAHDALRVTPRREDKNWCGSRRGQLADAAVGEAFNIATSNTYSLLDIIHVIESILGHKVERKHSPMRRGDVRKTWADITRAKRFLGYKPVMNFENGIRDTWNYFTESYFKNLRKEHAAGEPLVVPS